MSAQPPVNVALKSVSQTLLTLTAEVRTIADGAENRHELYAACDAANAAMTAALVAYNQATGAISLPGTFPVAASPLPQSATVIRQWLRFRDRTQGGDL